MEQHEKEIFGWSGTQGGHHIAPWSCSPNLLQTLNCASSMRCFSLVFANLMMSAGRLGCS